MDDMPLREVTTMYIASNHLSKGIWGPFEDGATANSEFLVAVPAPVVAEALALANCYVFVTTTMRANNFAIPPPLLQVKSLRTPHRGRALATRRC